MGILSNFLVEMSADFFAGLILYFFTTYFNSKRNSR